MQIMFFRCPGHTPGLGIIELLISYTFHGKEGKLASKFEILCIEAGCDDELGCSIQLQW